MQMGTEIKVSHRQTTGTIYCRKYTKHDDGGGQVTARQRLLYTRNGHWIHSWDPRQNPTSHNLPPPTPTKPTMQVGRRALRYGFVISYYFFCFYTFCNSDSAMNADLHFDSRSSYSKGGGRFGMGGAKPQGVWGRESPSGVQGWSPG